MKADFASSSPVTRLLREIAAGQQGLLLFPPLDRQQAPVALVYHI